MMMAPHVAVGHDVVEDPTFLRDCPNTARDSVEAEHDYDDHHQLTRILMLAAEIAEQDENAALIMSEIVNAHVYVLVNTLNMNRLNSCLMNYWMVYDF